MLKRSSSEPMYQQISNFLRKKIKEGIYKEGTKIPTETELMEKFNVSRTTVRLALKEIIDDGLIIRKPGKGTFVKSGKVYHNLKGFKGLYETLLDAGLNPETKLLNFYSSYPNEDVKIALKLESDSPVLKVLRLYHIKQEPIALAEISIHPDYMHLLTKEDAELYPVYETIAKRGKFRIQQANFEIFADNANSIIAKALNIEENEAVLGAERILFSTDGNPVEHTYLWFKANSYRFTLSLQEEPELQLKSIKKLKTLKKLEE